jgi:hypothetical protein
MKKATIVAQTPSWLSKTIVRPSMMSSNPR